MVSYGPARFETRSDGYERWRAWDPRDRRERYVYVHQLVCIADGADPTLVFSDGEYHVHHGNRIRWDNRSSNLSLLNSDEHEQHHREHRETGRKQRVVADGGRR